MRKRLQRVFSVLCALALLLGCVSLAAAEGTEANAVSVVTLIWDDMNDQDALRPESVAVALTVNGAPYMEGTLNADNNWACMAVKPADAEAAWQVTAPEGYTVKQGKEKNGTVAFTATHTPETVDVTVRKQWAGDENALSRRPAFATVQLLNGGVAVDAAALTAANGWAYTWKKLPKFQNTDGKAQEIVYTVQETAAPEGYTAQVSGSADAGFVVTNTLETAALNVSVSVSGAPAGADLSGIKFEISGPDDRLPLTVGYGEVAGGYTLKDAPMGSYLVKEIYTDGLIEGYTLDGKTSVTVGAASLSAGKDGAIALTNRFVEAEEAVEGTQKEAETPAAADLAKLTFTIDGPDERMPMTVTYDQFVDGKFVLEDAKAGTYTVVETNAGTLLDGFALNIENSNQGATAEVGTTTVTAKLVNVYDKLTPTEGPTEEPEETPEPSETPAPEPTPEPPADINIPVVKTWVDNDNRDGNRPDTVVVRLLADGEEVAQAILSGANGWSHVFENLPRMNGEEEIEYTVTEDPVPLYEAHVNEYHIVNTYRPVTVTATVTKIWNDNNNAAGLRPKSIYATLSNGTTVLLSAENNWTATVTDLPATVNGQPAVYTWTEQEVLGYQQTNVTTMGNNTAFTNSLYQRPTPPPNTKPPKTPGTPYLIIEEYGTPLGVEIVINHVGDCFD